MKTNMTLMIAAAVATLAMAGCEKHPETQPQAPVSTNSTSGATAPGTSVEKSADTAVPAQPETKPAPSQ